jgi:cellobiose phosphorylase
MFGQVGERVAGCVAAQVNIQHLRRNRLHLPIVHAGATITVMSDIARYGRFITDDDCFELNAEPPRKWRNTHYTAWGGTELYTEVSNLGDGFVRERDVAGNTVQVVAWDSKYLYIRDEDSGLVFCPWGAPAPQAVTDRHCRFYPERTEIAGTAGGLRAVQRVFVPRDVPVEVWTVWIENQSDAPRTVSTFAYAKFNLGGCDHDGRGVAAWDIHAQVHADLGGVIAVNRDRSCPTDRYKGYLVATSDIRGADAYRDQFLRSEFSTSTPRILWGHHCQNQPGFGPDCAAAVQVTRQIPAHGRIRVDYLLGACSGPAEVAALRAQATPERIDAWLAEARAVERRHAAAFRVDLGSEHADRAALMNHFVKKQCSSYLIDKSGFRDNLQVDCAIGLYDYPLARANLLAALASQKPDGSVLHSFRPRNRHHYSDKPAWILMTVPWLIQESGEVGLLDEVVPYFESDQRGTVWDHVQRAWRHLAGDLGKRGLCDQHFADWNDSLEPSPETGARESVMVSQQLCHGLWECAHLAERRGDAASATECRRLHAEMAARINAVAWDGAWYQRTICEDGHPLGSARGTQGRIFVNTQSWAVLGRIAERERLMTAMRSVDQHIEKPFGFAICDPPMSQFDPRVGVFSTRRPGWGENGGCYCHAAGFKLVADCILGRPEEAWRTFVKVAPGAPELPISQSQVEPFSFTNMYLMFPEAYGRAGYPWRTGTAGWMAMGLIEWILGARRHYDGLLIDPCLTRTIPRASLVRTFRGATYRIAIDNTAGRCCGVRSLILDGAVLAGTVIPPQAPGSVHEVQVIV